MRESQGLLLYCVGSTPNQGHSNPGNCASNFMEKISHYFVTFTSALLEFILLHWRLLQDLDR